MSIHEKPGVDPNIEGPRTVELVVSGMTCSGCVGRVQRALSEEPGVSQAAVDLATGTATATYEAGGSDPHLLVDAVRRAGYRAEVKGPAGGGARS